MNDTMNEMEFRRLAGSLGDVHREVACAQYYTRGPVWRGTVTTRGTYAGEVWTSRPHVTVMLEHDRQGWTCRAAGVSSEPAESPDRALAAWSQLLQGILILGEDDGKGAT